MQQDFSSPETFNSDFYLDEIHPNSDALKRLLNYIFSELGGSEVHQTMTVTGSDTKTLAEIQVELPINLSEE